MKLETFFEKFELFSDAPNAVQKMRELILELAAHGKLVAQLQDDEPAAPLLARIEKHIETLRKKKEFRGLPIDPLDDEGLPKIPHSWEWVSLGNVVDYGSSDKAESAHIPANAWLLDLEDIEKDTSVLLQRKSFRDNPSKSTKTAFNAGDVLYGKLRPYLNKVIVADAPGYCTTEIIPIRTFGFIAPAYLCYALKRPEFIAYANSKSYGMNLPRLGTEDARRAPFPLPPLAEQKRIVAKVDELMALCDRLEAQQQQRAAQHSLLARAAVSRFADAPTPANLDFIFHNAYAITPADLRKTILILAVQGKLVPQDAKDESATVLLEAIENERHRFAQAYKFRAPIAEPIDESLVPFAIPDSWLWCRLSSMFNAITDDDHLPPPKSEDGIAFLTIGNITTGKLEFEGSRFVPSSYYQGLADFRRPVRGDILYTVVGATYGRPAFVDTDRPFCVQRHIAILKPPKNAAVGYLMTLLQSPLVYEQASSGTTGTAQPTIPLGTLRNFVVPLPPLDEQRRIVAKVDELMKLVDQLEAQLAASSQQAEQLMQAIIAELTIANSKAATVDRSAIACYVLQRMRSNPSFARTAEVKVLYLAETHLGLPLGGQYHREAAGPFDKWIYDFERQAEKEGWFRASSERLSSTRSITRYKLLPGIKDKVDQALKGLGDKRVEFDRLLDAFMSLSTEDIEIVGTLFAAWNDALLDGEHPDNDWIIREVRENWHVSKQRFSPEKLSAWLVWMRKHDLVPVGKGPRTIYQPGFELVE